MPSISTNPANNNVIGDIKGAMLKYAKLIVTNEPPATKPLAYAKRMKLAREFHLDADAYAQRALELFLGMNLDILVAANGDLYAYIGEGGGSGFNLFQAQVALQSSSYQNASYDTGLSVWDFLAGVNQGDIV